MGAAQVIGGVIASVVVSKAVSSIGPKLGLGESTSNMLGMAAGLYAGGLASGVGSTPASQATATATPTTAGADIPTGYGGSPTAGTHHPGVSGSPAGIQPSGAVTSPLTPQGSQMTASLQAAPTTPTGHTAVAPPGQLPPVEAAARPGIGSTTSQAGQQQGMLKTGTDTGQIESTTQAASGKGQTADKVMEEGTTNWWEKLFSPEKTMDLIMAGMQGYGQAGLREYELEYPEKVAKENEKGWLSTYGGSPSSLNYSPPSRQ